jgi:hypothetical protein
MHSQYNRALHPSQHVERDDSPRSVLTYGDSPRSVLTYDDSPRFRFFAYFIVKMLTYDDSPRSVLTYGDSPRLGVTFRFQTWVIS